MSTRDDIEADAEDSRWDHAEEPETEEKVKPCPKCGSKEVYDKIRLYPEHLGVIDVGFECDACGWQWGFELSEPSQGKP